MAKKAYEVVAVTGSYSDRDGNTRKRYQRCGVVFENDRGLSLKLEAIPVGGEWNGWLMLMEPRDNREPRGGGGSYNAPAAKEQAPQDGFEDIPFLTSAGIW